MLPSAAFNSRTASASLTPSFVVRTSSQWRLSVTLPPLYAVHLRIRWCYHTPLLKIVVSRDDLEFDIEKTNYPRLYRGRIVHSPLAAALGRKGCRSKSLSA